VKTFQTYTGVAAAAYLRIPQTLLLRADQVIE